MGENGAKIMDKGDINLITAPDGYETALAEVLKLIEAEKYGEIFNDRGNPTFYVCDADSLSTKIRAKLEDK